MNEFHVSVMTILQTKFDKIPVVIENITASVHITYYAHITPSYPTLALKGFDVQNSTDSVYIVYTLLPVAEQTQYVHVLYQLTMLDVHKRY